MTDVSHLYPPTPTHVPADLTTPSGHYRFRVTIVLLCLLVFVAIYLGLTIGSAYASFACFAALARDDPKPSLVQSSPTEKRYRGSNVTFSPPHARRPTPV